MVIKNRPAGAVTTYIFDLDGVVYRGKDILPHSRETIDRLKKSGHNVRFFTNNATKSRRQYLDKLSSFGVETSIDEIMTSSYAAALYFEENNESGKTVFRIGEEGMSEELRNVGMEVIEDPSKNGVAIDYVVVGMDRYFDYNKLLRAQQAIVNGAKFIATNEDKTFPVENGNVLPGGGTMVAAVRAATSVEPLVMGKPETYAFKKIMDLAGATPEDTVMVGDRLDTDIAAGNRAGAWTVLVLTGVNTREDADNAADEMLPNEIIKDLSELI